MPVRRKLSDDQVREIRQSNETNIRLGAQHGVNSKVILNIKRNDTYKDVPAIELRATEEAVSPPHNEYILGDDLSMLEALPERYAETIVIATSSYDGHASSHPPTRRQAYGPGHKEHIDYHQAVIKECLRVAGPSGVVFFHLRYSFDEKTNRLTTWEDMFKPFPLRQMLTLKNNYVPKPKPEPEPKLMYQLPTNADRLYVLAGHYWRIPEETENSAQAWGTVWNANVGRKLKPGWMPTDIADRCVALGRGRVLSFQRFDNVILSAVRRHRSWLMVGQDPEYQEYFERRLNILQDQMRLSSQT